MSKFHLNKMKYRSKTNIMAKLHPKMLKNGREKGFFKGIKIAKKWIFLPLIAICGIIFFMTPPF